MCPDDPTPLGDAMTHRFPDQKIPEPEPGGHAPGAARNVDVGQRPSLPDHGQATEGAAGQDADTEDAGTARKEN